MRVRPVPVLLPLVATVCLSVTSCGPVAGHGVGLRAPRSRHGAAPVHSLTDSSVLRDGAHGSGAWVLSASGLSVSADGGQTWTVLPLPTGVLATAVSDVDVLPAGQVWLTAASGPDVSVFHKTSFSATWSSSTLAPAWPSDVASSSTASSSLVADQAGTVAVLVARPPDFTGGQITRLFVSTNGGTTFVPRSTPPVLGGWDIEFSGASNALAVSQSAMVGVYYTTDGGTSWSPSSVPALAQESDVALGTPVASGTTWYLPARVTAGGISEFEVYESSDAGATFALDGEALGTSGAASATGVLDPSPPAMAALGQELWVVSPEGGAVYQSQNGGQTWSTVSAPTLTGQVQGLSLLSDTAATAEVQLETGACSGLAGKQGGCLVQQYLLSTADAGQHWAAAQP
jgi:hypothetical protein